MLTIEQARTMVADGMAQRAANIAAGRSPSFGLNDLQSIAQQVSVTLPDSIDTFMFYSGT